MAWTRKSSLPQLLLDEGEDGVEAGRVGHVAMAGDKRAEFGGQRLDALLEGFALIGQRNLGALVGAGLGDAPGDRPVVGDAKDQALLAGHQAVSTRHSTVLRALESRISEGLAAINRIMTAHAAARALPIAQANHAFKR